MTSIAQHEACVSKQFSDGWQRQPDAFPDGWQIMGSNILRAMFFTGNNGL